MPTKAELEAENDELRAKLEQAREIIDEALDLEEDEDSEEDED
jgi:hypothetical protein